LIVQYIQFMVQTVQFIVQYVQVIVQSVQFILPYAGETGVTCYNFPFFLHRAMAIMAMGLKFVARCSPACDLIMCTTSGNWYLEELEKKSFTGVLDCNK